MAPSEPADDGQPPHARHYPLDMHLPFEHYEHRRLVARDVLVNRVMSKLLFPASKGLAQAYDSHRSHENGLHDFAPIRRHDRALARDLELLRKMLTTCSITDDRSKPPYSSAQAKSPSSTAFSRAGPRFRTWHTPREDKEGKVIVTVGEEIQDLVRRHYLETDDACLRVWLQTIKPPSLSSYDTLPDASRPAQTHAASAQRRKRRDAIQIANDGKKWYKEDTQSLAAIQAKMQATRLPSLHDGGAFLPQLRLPLFSSKAARMDYLRSSTDVESDSLLLHGHFRDRIMDTIYPWPEGQAPRRVLRVPSYSWLSNQRLLHTFKPSPPVEFSGGMTGRGPIKNVVWSTAAHRNGVSERGRSARRSRRRATSEPPHGMFTSARLPLSFDRLECCLIFPRMNIETMYQRSRRRSLSRTRIAEMFDWNARPRQAHEQGRLQGEARCESQHDFHPTISTYEHSTLLHELSECVEDSIHFSAMDGEKAEWALLNKLLHRVLEKVVEDRTGKHPCPNCASRHLTCPKPCGFCGAPSPDSSCIVSALHPPQLDALSGFPGQENGQPGNLHTAANCPVAKQNRCKCGPFPQYHVAAKCAVLCSRDCGNAHPPGHFKHKNAMTCKARCCMCGIKGHSGSQCKLKRCRCGGSHLGQDCSWKVECRVEGCYRFLCGLHCSECGMSREQLEEGTRFEGRKCAVCLERTNLDYILLVQNTEGSGDEAETSPITNPSGDVSHRRGRKNPRKKRGTKSKDQEKENGEAELPWYTPLQPRTRPIVVSKSGKRNTWREPAKKC